MCLNSLTDQVLVITGNCACYQYLSVLITAYISTAISDLQGSGSRLYFSNVKK